MYHDNVDDMIVIRGGNVRGTNLYDKIMMMIRGGDTMRNTIVAGSNHDLPYTISNGSAGGQLPLQRRRRIQAIGKRYPP